MFIKAILFDLDGVLVDAVEIHEMAFIDAVRCHTGQHITISYHSQYLNGLPTDKKLDLLVEEGIIESRQCEDILETKQRNTQNLIQQQIKADSAKTDMLLYFKNKGFKVGCVTNSTWPNTFQLLKAAGLIEHLDIIISRDNVINPKPHPEPYWKAMMKIDVHPYQTLVIEDSSKGVESARIANTWVMRVEGPHIVNIQEIEECLEVIKTYESTRTDGGTWISL